MKTVKLIVSSVLALVVLSTSAFAAERTKTDAHMIRSAVSVNREETLSEKLETFEDTQEQYDKIIAGRSRIRGTWGDRKTHSGSEEQIVGQHRTAEDRTEITEGNGWGNRTWTRDNNAEERADGRKATMAGRYTEGSEDGSSSNLRGGMRGNMKLRNQ